MEMNFLLAIFGGLIANAWFLNKRMKVQDKQFETIIARLNELTKRDYDDLSSDFDKEE